MGSLDNAKLKKFLSHLLKGDWVAVFPTRLFAELEDWFKNHREEESLVVRFTFFEEKNNSMEKYAVHLLCNSVIKKSKVKVLEAFIPDEAKDELPLAIPPVLYEYPLFCMPGANELLDDLEI